MSKFQEIERKSGLIVTEIEKFFSSNSDMDKNFLDLKVYGNDTIVIEYIDADKVNYKDTLIPYLVSLNIAEIDWAYGETGEFVVYIEG